MRIANSRKYLFPKFTHRVILEMQDELITSATLASKLDISIDTLCRWEKLGKLPPPEVRSRPISSGRGRKTVRWSWAKVRRYLGGEQDAP